MLVLAICLSMLFSLSACSSEGKSVTKRMTVLGGLVEITAYGKNAENCAAMLHKGDHIVACGRLAQDVWTGEDGRVYSRLYIKADTILFPQPSRPA